MLSLSNSKESSKQKVVYDRQDRGSSNINLAEMKFPGFIQYLRLLSDY